MLHPWRSRLSTRGTVAFTRDSNELSGFTRIDDFLLLGNLIERQHNRC